jgi:outer membrane immunogenic protein
MKRLGLIFGAIALCAFATGQAQAQQDILRMVRSPVPIANWSGFYVGGNFGYGWGKTKMTGDNLLLATGTADTNGTVIGGQLGGGFQTGNGYFGLEADIQGSWQKGSFVQPVSVGGVAFNFNETNSLPWFGTTRARFGLIKDGLLAYGTAGFAFGQFRNDEVVTGALTGSSSYSTYRYGWAAGGGLEAMVGQNWAVRVEYLHVDFGAFTQAFSVSAGGVTTVGNISFKVTNDIVRGGVSYYFR